MFCPLGAYADCVTEMRFTSPGTCRLYLFGLHDFAGLITEILTCKGYEQVCLSLCRTAWFRFVCRVYKIVLYHQVHLECI
jgi:hypothetical protein